MLLFCTTFIFGQNKSSLTPSDQSWIEKTIQEHAQRNEVPSVVFALVRTDQAVNYYSYGIENWSSKVPVNEQTNYQIGSLSKLFTGTIIHHLIQDGAIDPQVSISQYLDEHLDQKILEKIQSIQVRDLLHHRAGMPNHGPSSPPTPNGIAMRGGYSQEVLLADLAVIDIKENFSEQMSYSNYAYGLLGFIATQVSGQSYAELLDQYILSPYQLASTTSDESQATHLATPYFIGKRTKATQAWEMGSETPAGGIFSNAKDLSQLMQHQLTVYQKKALKSPLFLTKDKRLFDRSGYMEYGYGFMETRSYFDSTATKFEHGGDLDGFASQYKFFPELGLGYVLLTSSGGTWINELDAVIEQKILGLPIPEPIQLSSKILKSFTGKYRFSSGFKLELVKVGSQLKALFPGSDPVNIYPASETKLFFRHMNVQMDFTKNAKGNIEKVSYIQNGKAFYPEKVK
ncbi:MAG: hypothetical protein Sapg2KO_35770 [Saprospiraceae bacterium]